MAQDNTIYLVPASLQEANEGDDSGSDRLGIVLVVVAQVVIELAGEDAAEHRHGVSLHRAVRPRPVDAPALAVEMEQFAQTLRRVAGRCRPEGFAHLSPPQIANLMRQMDSLCGGRRPVSRRCPGQRSLQNQNDNLTF